ncbi:MAG TPA: flagellar accessory protein FlaH [Candidatus Bathyarchaeota archaeon]|nr:flagellar accessory protein FlaH [Candidatus Bathyarchaeota archaeon]
MSGLGEDENILKLNNPELDRKMGGLPLPSLTLVEGPNDSGKTVMVQQFTYGALTAGKRVLYITTEDTAKGLIKNMERLNWNVTDYYLVGDLRVTTMNTLGMEWSEEVSKYYLIALTNFIKKKGRGYDIIVVDSLTHLLTYANENDVLDFFSTCRFIVDTLEQTFIMTIHPYAINQELMIRIRSFCDGHLVLEIKTFRNQTALTVNVAKLKGATRSLSETISFEVSPAYGIKILPFSSTRG